MQFSKDEPSDDLRIKTAAMDSVGFGKGFIVDEQVVDKLEQVDQLTTSDPILRIH